MDFQEALEATTVKERDELIRDEIDESDLPFEDCMEHGGWPDNEYITGITIGENDKENLLVITVNVTGTESVPTGCKDANRPYPFTATFELQVDRETGNVLSEELKGCCSDDEDVNPGDYY